MSCVGVYGYNWFLSKYIVGVTLLIYSHMFLDGSMLATRYILTKIPILSIQTNYK
jgi:hypothetical protein